MLEHLRAGNLKDYVIWKDGFGNEDVSPFERLIIPFLYMNGPSMR
jgi:hypothetical protein